MCKDTGEWVYGSLVCDRGEADIIREDGSVATVLPYSVGQFTGSIDANGTEIYEGDSVAVAGISDLLTVVFDGGAFRLATEKQKACLDSGEHPFMSDYRMLPVLAELILETPCEVVLEAQNPDGDGWTSTSSAEM